ncbi:uncharacterized protein H6S33_000574 [Morchella sextelata]|uniref:uncharacterized protein n=1 Tax=Morchella sextelata TaxID=1174677 RepID=UPI001D05300F|nr:uncharacterized protein H6S33_009917 [Morchella sextelata]XP_044700133.1 uncharacterized protein H6S33_000574 [Morchella sextelata]KAH0602218.1 hypothetical protein H6S33_009917 [Morchella sextelata]KAH0614938.1 hypothetical protein H6S33_000574 [Morchella sextelata]
MASESYFLGVDVGTGSARVCIIDSTGEIKGVESKEIQTWNPRANYYEQSTADIWFAICYCSRLVLQKLGVDPELVKGIGFDATCSLAVMSEDTNEPISVAGPDFTETARNVILWMDHRPVKETAKINATKHNLLQYVGGSMSIEMEIPKVLWLKNNMPKELFERCKFYDLADVLTHLATGKETRSFCSAVCKQGFVPVGIDGSVKGWQDDFLNAIGLPELCEDNFRRMGGVHGQNGTMLSAGELVGELSESAAKELGLKAGTKIGSGVIDAYAGWIGTVGAKVKMSEDLLDQDHAKSDIEQCFKRLAAVAGTSTCHLVMSRDPVFVPGVWGPYRDVLLPGFWMAEGGQSSTGSLLHNVLTTHASHAKALEEAKIAGTNIFDYLNSHLEDMRKAQNAPTIAYVARHLFFYGDKHGNRSPIADPEMRGSIVGLSMDSSVDDLALQYFTAMEFIAQQTRHIIEALNNSGHSITSIFMSGGQCKNKLLMHLIADATGYPVSIPRYIDAAVVLGAAMLGAKAASVDAQGNTANLWTIMDKMSKPGTIIEPTTNEKEKKLLDAKYKVFLEMAKAQQAYRKSIDEAVGDWSA